MTIDEQKVRDILTSHCEFSEVFDKDQYEDAVKEMILLINGCRSFERSNMEPLKDCIKDIRTQLSQAETRIAELVVRNETQIKTIVASHNEAEALSSNLNKAVEALTKIKQTKFVMRGSSPDLYNDPRDIAEKALSDLSKTSGGGV